MVVIATNDLARKAGIKAGMLVKKVASRLGGGGGGKDDMAQGGGQDLGAIDSALSEVTDYIENM